jgi:hypothetical protein
MGMDLWEGWISVYAITYCYCAYIVKEYADRFNVSCVHTPANLQTQWIPQKPSILKITEISTLVTFVLDYMCSKDAEPEFIRIPDERESNISKYLVWGFHCMHFT